MNCPCGSKQTYENCCEPYILGKKHPKTALDLLKSRYSAFAKKEFIYIEDTMRGKAREDFTLQQCQKDSLHDVWMGLTIFTCEEGLKQDDMGSVEFVGHCVRGDHILHHHEKSEFSKINGRWYYVDAVVF